jgi:hypothetical protein
LELTNAAAETIPTLRPPRGEIPAGFWEQHGLLVVLVSVGCLLLVAAAVWWITRPKALDLLSPAEQARRALEPLRSRSEDGLVLSQVSQILRRYFLAAFGMAKAELTTTEFQRAIEANDQVEPALASDLNQFLRNCDQRKFAPGATQPACGAVDRALEFIVRAETRLTVLREPSGSAPVTTTKKESAVG